MISFFNDNKNTKHTISYITTNYKQTIVKGTDLGITSQKKIMNYQDAIAEINLALPSCREEFKETYKANNSFMVISTFTRQIRNAIQDQNQKILTNALQKMNELYDKGDTALKNAIENVFIYALDSMTFSCGIERRTLVFSQLSSGLNSKYLQQVYKTGL